jgi:hypothetical protein
MKSATAETPRAKARPDAAIARRDRATQRHKVGTSRGQVSVQVWFGRPAAAAIHATSIVDAATATVPAACLFCRAMSLNAWSVWGLAPARRPPSSYAVGLANRGCKRLVSKRSARFFGP